MKRLLKPLFLLVFIGTLGMGRRAWAETITFTSNTPYIAPGESATLSWRVPLDALYTYIQDPTGAFVEEGVYNGSANVSPAFTSTYLLTAIGNGFFLTQQLTITVIPPPTANNQSLVAPVNATTPITLVGTDPSGYALTYTILTQPTNGTLTGAAPNMSYTPSLAYAGSDSFTFKVNNGYFDSAAATVSIGISGPSEPQPVPGCSVDGTGAFDGVGCCSNCHDNGEGSGFIPLCRAATYCGTGPTANFIANPTTIPYGATSSLSWRTFEAGDMRIDPTVGDVTSQSTYDSNGLATGSTTVQPLITTTYTLTAGPPPGNPGAATTVQQTVTVLQPSGSISASPNPCLIPNLTTTSCSSTISWTSTHALYVGVWLGTDGGATQTLFACGTTGPGAAASIPSGSHEVFSLYATPNACGASTNPTTGILVAQVTVAATPFIPPPPMANGQNVTTPMNTSVPITLSGTDPSGLPLTYTILTLPSNGTLSGTGPNRTYVPNTNYVGPDTFTFKVNNGYLDSPAASVNIQVEGPPAACSSLGCVGAGGEVFVGQQGLCCSGQDVNTGLGVAFCIGPDPAPCPIINNFTATPGTILNGQTSTLAWTTTNAASAFIDQGVGVVAVNGNRPVMPSVTTVYTLTASNGAGASVTQQAIVAVACSIGQNCFAPNTCTPDQRCVAPPVANNLSATTPFQTPAPFLLQGSDPNTPPLSLTYVKVSDPLHGTVSAITGNQITYQPASGYAGSDSFTYKVNNGFLDSNTASVDITVQPPTTGPTANNQTVSTPFRTPITITLTGTDPNGLILSYMKVTAPANGTVTAISGNQITYTPASTFGGAADSFTFMVINSLGQQSSPATVTVNVGLPTNGLPVANNQIVSTAFRTPITITLTGTDPNGLTLSYVKVTDPANGTVTAISGNQITYTPGSAFAGTDSFTFKVVNSLAQESVPATVAINVGLPTNGLPIANNQAVATPFRTPITITLTGTDPNGLTLSYVKVSDPANGSVTAISGNQITYTPASTFGGAADSFTFMVVNSLGQQSSPASVTVNVGLPTNGLPVADNQTVSTPFRTPITITLTGTDPNGLILSYMKVTAPANGTVTAISGNQITYTPASTFGGAADSFTFMVINSLGQQSSPATVTVNVGLPTNGLPVANSQTVATPFRTPVTITLTGTDPNGLTLNYVKVSDPANGVVTSITGNQIIYTPNPTFAGTDNFSFKVVNSLGQESLPATVTVNVGLPTNGLPVANNQTVGTPFETPITITLTGTDPNGLSLSYVKLSDPSNGSVTAITGNQITYAPNSTFVGADNFTFKVVNSLGQQSSPATVTVNVGLPASAPVANPQTVSTPFSTPVIITLIGTDPNGLSLTYVKASDPANGTVSAIVNGDQITYTPNVTFGGAADSFTFKVINSLGQSSLAAVVMINVGAPPAGGGPSTAPFLARIDVEPKGKIISLGDSLQFTAQAFDNTGKAMTGVDFVWQVSSTDGVSFQSGSFKAIGAIPATRKYTVTASSNSVSDNADVTVEVGTAGGNDICGAVAYPVPYKSSSGLPGVTFTHLAPATRIRIFTSDARIVRTLFSQNGENVLWDLKNNDGDKVASWVYYYILEQSGGACSKKDGKLVIIQ